MAAEKVRLLAMTAAGGEPDGAGDQRTAAGHGLGAAQAEALVSRRQDRDREALVDPPQVGLAIGARDYGDAWQHVLREMIRGTKAVPDADQRQAPGREVPQQRRPVPLDQRRAPVRPPGPAV